MAGKNGDAPEGLRGLVTVIAAVVVLLGCAALMIYLVGRAGRADFETWSRYLYLFGAVQALVFTALGWLFGREVNLRAVRNAEARADRATATLEEVVATAARHEANGRALRAAVETRDDDQPSDLARLARALFPNR